MGPDFRLGGRGGGVARGHIAMIVFPITFIVHNKKSNSGGGEGGGAVRGP